MKKIFAFLLLILISSISFIFGDDKPAIQTISEQRELSKFTNIKLTCKANIYITQGSTQSVTIKTDNKTLTNLKTEVNNDILTISLFTFTPPQILDIDIVMEDINTLTVNGSGNIKVNNELNIDTLNFFITGSGSITSKINSNYIYTKIFGSGNINLSGSAKTYDLEITGSGQVNASDLTSDAVKISLGSAGICNVKAVNELNITITGAGDIKYSGIPPKIKIKINGSGSVESM
jgi:hypothetical protein